MEDPDWWDWHLLAHAMRDEQEIKDAGLEDLLWTMCATLNVSKGDLGLVFDVLDGKLR